MPPLFCYPHQIHGLIYLDPVGAAEGELCVLPGSHRDPALDLPGDSSDQPGQLRLAFAAGDCILMHGNLWHRTTPTSADCGPRRLVLFGFSPAWIKTGVTRGVPAEHPLTADLDRDDPELAELLGEFHW
jgi:ectoine hydroxylase-related dioxygenase (phytanoyl-CoA dioxygenase family)